MRWLLILLLLPLQGCLLELLTTTAIQGELAAQDAQASTRVLNHAKESTARNEAQQAIGIFQAEHGYYPASLSVLVPEYLPRLPLHPNGQPYGYDPQSGRLLDAPQTQAVVSSIPYTQEDGRNLERLKKAVYLYWESTGYYPGELDDLDPLYIDKVPRLTSGGAFVYDPETAAVYHPAELQQPVSGRQTPRQQRYRGGGGGGGGAGPLGEVMTGIAIQNQLGNMNSSGTSSAATRARGGLGNVQGDYNARQQRALEDIHPQ